MAKIDKVPRPTKKSEYTISFASTQARRGWTDLCATIRGPLADSWDFLTRNPMAITPTNYRLRGELGVIVRDGVEHDRWQHKPTQQGDARIWFYVVDRTVHLENVHTRHPNQTK